MHWYLEVLKNYVGFQGRARRKEYWMFNLFSAIVIIVLSIVELVAGLSSLLSGLYTLAVLLPSLAVSIRRLHDTGRSGWWILIGLIPLIGSIILLVFMCLDGQKNENQFGPSPKV
ncbi:DUF805 domain-containing protein [Psychrobacillus vulpis]|uniref:DUF805 domain-containing protein n=1 Tax=Psychrobacillus vulpis TaxID=2325572 RepID=A0A544TUX9_9BACI|nr:DUF805 domain-containing protein [Psychrobacillus vulpis]TQR21253.1 DUF805 domain-containing protein [Psychrobacillus vulpis]